jgi:hypothetical protein
LIEYGQNPCDNSAEQGGKQYLSDIVEIEYKQREVYHIVDENQQEQIYAELLVWDTSQAWSLDILVVVVNDDMVKPDTTQKSNGGASESVNTQHVGCEVDNKTCEESHKHHRDAPHVGWQHGDEKDEKERVQVSSQINVVKHRYLQQYKNHEPGDIAKDKPAIHLPPPFFLIASPAPI